MVPWSVKFTEFKSRVKLRKNAYFAYFSAFAFPKIIDKLLNLNEELLVPWS